MKLRNECPSGLLAGSPEHLDAMVEWCRWRCHRTCGWIAKWSIRARKWDTGFVGELGVWIEPDSEYADTLRGEADFHRESLQEERVDLKQWKSYRESGDESSLCQR